MRALKTIALAMLAPVCLLFVPGCLAESTADEQVDESVGALDESATERTAESVQASCGGHGSFRGYGGFRGYGWRGGFGGPHGYGGLGWRGAYGWRGGCGSRFPY